MDERGFLLNTAQFSGSLQERVVNDESRPHMHEYALLMHMSSSDTIVLRLRMLRTLRSG